MATFLLCSGAWAGAQYWKHTQAALEDAGHIVFRPTYTGLGERRHLLSPDVNLDTHIDDILGVIRFDELDDFILVGHSYGGMVITGVADKVAHKLAGLVYLDAALPADGQSMMDLVLPERRQQMTAIAEAEGEGWKVPWVRNRNMGDAPTETLKWLGSLVGPHPLAAFTQPIRIDGNHLAAPNKTYLLATLYDPSPFQPFHAWADAEPDWKTDKLESNHFPMLTMAEETARILADAATG